MHITDGAQRILPGPLGDQRAGDQPHRGHVSGGEKAVRSFWPACRWRPSKRTASRGPQAPEDWSQRVPAERTLHQAQLFFSTPGPLRTRARTGWGGIPCKRTTGAAGPGAGAVHRVAQERHVAPTSKSQGTHARRGPAHPTRRQVDSVAMKRKPRLSLLQTATRQISAIVRPP